MASEKKVDLKDKAFMKEIGKLDAELAKQKPNPGVVDSQIRAIRSKSEALVVEIDLLKEKYFTDDNENKYLECEEKLTAVQHLLDDQERKAFIFLKANPAPAPAAASEYKVNLPQLKLQEFTGDVRQWLSFWAGYGDIHKNPNIPDADKFQYLLQCIPANSAARKRIESFPVCAGNYQNAVAALRDTFGRESMLIKVYVRDLIQLIVQKALQKSSLDLGELVPQLTSQIRNLEELGVTSNKCEDILYPMVESCLPEEVLQAWQRHPDFNAKLEDILRFMNSEVQNQMERSLAKMEFSTETAISSSRKRNRGKTEEQQEVATASALSNVTSGGGKNRSCPFCDGKRHAPQKCFKAKTMTLKDKQEALRKRNLCFKCLRGGHRSTECSAAITCSLCNGAHYDIMCRGAVQESSQESAANRMMMVRSHQQLSQGIADFQGGYYNQQPMFAPPMNQQMVSQQQQQQAQAPPSFIMPRNSQVVATTQQQPEGAVQTRRQFQNLTTKNVVALMTLLVRVDTKSGTSIKRMFLDGGSEESYFDTPTATLCNYEQVGSQTIRHQIFGARFTEPEEHPLLNIKLWNLQGTVCREFVFNVVPKIAHSIPKPCSEVVEDLGQRGVPLHDQTNFSEEVQILAGSDILAQIWTGGFVRINTYLVAKETIFGWVVQGKTPMFKHVSVAVVQMAIAMMLKNLDFEQLWSLEALGIFEESRMEKRADLEKAALEHFSLTVTRNQSGRYCVRLPYIQGHRELMNNRSQAVARLRNLTVKLKKDGYLEPYNQVFMNWLKDGIIEEVPKNPVCPAGYYLPHRHVVKEGSTTPVRPVFDASARPAGGVSLNDILEKGPNLLELIPAIMTRFRLRRIGVTADIRQAFLQMEVAMKDRHVLRFVWWKNLDCLEIVEFQHRRVVFGVSTSPFLLAATLQYHLERFGKEWPEVAKKLLKSFYVDNAVSSHDTREEAEDFKQKSQQLLLPACFDLRGWELGPTDEEKFVPVLGMTWNTKEDYLSLCLENTLLKLKQASTKRGLLAAINSIFDPMGFVSPFTIIPKLLFQKCCVMGIRWDEKLPEEIEAPYDKWKRQVHRVQEVKIPRWMCAVAGESKLSLQTFSDASGFAYSCCVFLRSEFPDGSVNVKLVMAKSRVAPSKKTPTIPRLELLGCLIGVRLTKEVVKYLELPDIPCHYWSDSSTALAWICNDKPWGRFVQGRVDEIRKHTRPDQWSHVPGEMNPADLPSRGCMAEKLVHLQWWEGPDWLKKPMESWPKTKLILNEDEVLGELRKTVVSAFTQPKHDPLDILKKYGDFNFTLQVVAIILRYVDCLMKRRMERKSGTIEKLQVLARPYVIWDIVPVSTVDEMDRAEMVILRYVQRSSLNGEADSRLKKLSAFTDNNGLIRIRSQLFYGDEPFGMRCPIVLPSKHDIVTSIIKTEHTSNCHAGVMTLLALLRRKFWILKGRRTVSAVVNKCVRCRWFNAKRCEVPSAPLPKDRIKDTFAFDVTGVDLLGPLFLRGGQKIWVVLFTCAVFRCVHLEVTSTLSTEGFMKAFRRFVARRGRPSKIYSDNGLNFVGCENLFRELDWIEVQRYASVNRIEWVFNPPTAASWGGFWERLVGLTKKLLRRILGKSVVNMEDFVTILCDVEATLNQRPLGYQSEEDGSLVPLCPANFMRENPVGDLPEADAVDSATLREIAKRCQKVRECFRSRFRKEYLAELKHVAGNKERSVKPGDVVIVEADNKKRIDWQLGVVKKLFPGRDGKGRGVLVKTKTGEFSRPVQRLFILESLMDEERGKSEPDVLVSEVGIHPEKAEKVKTSRYGRNIKEPERLEYK